MISQLTRQVKNLTQMAKPKEFATIQDNARQINQLFVDFNTTINIFFAESGKLPKKNKPFAICNVI